MRLRSQRERAAAAGSDSDPQSGSYWMSYSDLMASLLLTFAVALVVMILVSKKDADAAAKLLADQVVLLEQEKEKTRNLEETMVVLSLRDGEQRRRVKLLEDELLGAKTAVRDLRGQVIFGQAAKQRWGIERDIVDRLREQFSGRRVVVNTDGSIAISDGEAVLFDQDSAELREEGKVALDAVLAAYLEVFFGNEHFGRYLNRIVVAGHTNTDGTYLYNSRLSLRRAGAVVDYLHTSYENRPEKERKFLEQHLVATGRSYSDPIRLDGKEDKDASRRIEFSFTLKDDEVNREIERMFADREPGS
jgi:chemotaxis protein MotB